MVLLRGLVVMRLRLDKGVLVVVHIVVVIVVAIVVVRMVQVPQTCTAYRRASLLVLYLLLDPWRSSLFPYIVWWRLTWQTHRHATAFTRRTIRLQTIDIVVSVVVVIVITAAASSTIIIVRTWTRSYTVTIG